MVAQDLARFLVGLGEDALDLVVDLERGLLGVVTAVLAKGFSMNV